MPTIRLTNEWSDPIALNEGDILQNRGGSMIEIHPGDPAADDAALRLPGFGGAMRIERAATVRGRAVPHGGVLSVVRGF